MPAAAVGGRVAMEFLDAQGSSLKSLELPASQRDLHLSHILSTEAQTVTVYFWNEATRVDGVGAAALERPATADAAEAGASLVD